MISRRQKYRENAAFCEDMAERAADDDMRTEWELLAAKWRHLSESSDENVTNAQIARHRSADVSQDLGWR